MGRSRGVGATGSPLQGRCTSSSTPGTSARRSSRGCSMRRVACSPCVSRCRSERSPRPRRPSDRPESLLVARQFDGLLDMLLGLWSRGYEPTRAVVVKATSSAGRLAPAILDRLPARARDLPEPGGRALPRDAPGRRQFRDRPARPRPGPHAPPAGGPRAAGRAALCALHGRAGRTRLAGRKPRAVSRQEAAGSERLLALDFEAFLADVPGAMTRAIAHFGLPHDDASIAAISRNPVLRQYSKAPELPFPPGERGARLAARAPRAARGDREGHSPGSNGWRVPMPSVAAVVAAGLP